jgi:rRNA maturation endonuclease Nob1
MCDEIDAAAELELLNVEIALKNRQRPAIEFTGQCHYCEETISKGSFCSRECGEDYQKVERAKQFKGAA